MSRQRKSDKYRLIEKRGVGRGKEYKPWLKVHEFGSLGRVHRISGWKSKRIHQLMSDLELYYFLVCQWEDNVIDIREQYPLLPLTQTIDIAEQLNINHPPKCRKNKTVMTTDFVITIRNGDKNQDIARTIKPEEQLNNNRVVEKFTIEKEFWKFKKIDWGIVTENKIPIIKAKNIKYIYNKFFWPEDQKYSESEIHYITYDFLNCLTKNNYQVIKTTNEFDKLYSWEIGESLNFFQYLITQKIILLDMNEKINFFKNKIRISEDWRLNKCTVSS